MSEIHPCWRNRFHPTNEPCPNEARWRSTFDGDHTVAKLMSKMTWCDEHRHENDAPISDDAGAER